MLDRYKLTYNVSIVVMCCVIDSSAFSYFTLHPSCAQRVTVLSVEDDGSVVCRPTSFLHDVTELQQQMNDIYTMGQLFEC